MERRVPTALKDDLPNLLPHERDAVQKADLVR